MIHDSADHLAWLERAEQERKQATHLRYDDVSGLARFTGPGGHTQIRLSRVNAEAIAQALGIEIRKAR